MPHMTFLPVDAATSFSFPLDGPAPARAISNNTTLAWSVRLEHGKKVRLSTGSRLNDIQGHVNIQVGDASPEGRSVFGEEENRIERWGFLRYFESDSSDFLSVPEQYFVSLYVSQRLFDRVLRLAERGHPPTVSIEVAEKSIGDLLKGEEPPKEFAMKYGWEPDGSGVEWNNKASPHVEITWCTFSAELGTPAITLPGGDDHEGKELDPKLLLLPTRADLAMIQDRVAKIDDRLGKFAGTVKMLGWLILAVLVIARLFR
jgi:hypothetical protein